jgi:hypothetical protein
VPHRRRWSLQTPYNLPIKQVQGRGRIKHADFAQGAGEMSRPEYIDFLRLAFALAAKHSVHGAIHFVFIDWRHIHELLEAGSAVYAELSRTSSCGQKRMQVKAVFIDLNTRWSASTGQATGRTSTTSNSAGTAGTGLMFGPTPA